MSKKLKFSLALLGVIAVSSAIVVPTCLVSKNQSNNGNNDNNNNSSGDNVENYNISDLGVQNFQDALLKINLDNYRVYFDESNIFPISEKARMSPLTASILSGELIPVDAINSVSFSESSNTDDGYLNVNVVIKLNSPYQYNGQDSINLNNIPTGIFNPNSDFNRSLFIISANTLNGFTEAGLNYTGTLYLPNNVNFVYIQNDYFVNNKVNSKVLSFEYANFINFASEYQQLLGSPFEFISFRGNTSFNTFNNFGMFESSQHLLEVDFTDCIKLQGLEWQTFFKCIKLEKVNFTNCQSLSYIGANTFYNCESLKELDFSASTLKSVDPTSFLGCSSLKTIYVKDEASKGLIETAVENAKLNNVSVIIK